MNHQLDYGLCPRSRIRDLRVSQRTVGSSDLQEAKQRFDTPIFKGRGDLVLGCYSVRIHPRHVGCRVRKARIESDREVLGPLGQLFIKVFGYRTMEIGKQVA